VHEICESKALEIVAANITESRLDRWFYATMAFVFASAAIIGFTPNSLAILDGTKENPPPLVHVHAMSNSLFAGNGYGTMFHCYGISFT